MAFSSSLLSSTSTVPYGIGAIPTNETLVDIDTVKRTINIPKSMKNLGVNGDHLSETIYFRIPRYFDNKDFSEHTCKVRWLNANNQYGESDVINLETTEDYVLFGWFITNQITSYAGDIQFTVQFETVVAGVQYQWQTTPATFTILQGIDENNIDPTGGDETVYRQIMDSINAINATLTSMGNVTQEIASLKTRMTAIETDVQYLKDHAVMAIENV